MRAPSTFGSNLNRTADKRALKQHQLASLIAEHLLAKGLQDNSIRTLAKAAGTSDRMLLYYFDTKEALIESVLALMIDGFTEALDQLVGKDKLSAEDLLQRLSRQVEGPSMRPMLTLWFEVIGLALRGEAPYNAIAKKMMRLWEDKIRDNLTAADREQAADVFALLEGRIMVRLLTQEASDSR